MGVVVNGSTPANPSGPVSWMDTILGSAGGLGDGFAAGFQGLLNGIGQVLQGAVSGVGAVFNGIVTGVTNMIGWIGNAIGSIFGRNAPKPEPINRPSIFNPIQTNLEGVLEPIFQEVEDLVSDAAALGDEITAINTGLSTITGQISDINGDISGINASMGNLNGSLTDLNTDLLEGLDPSNPQSPLWTIQGNINNVQGQINTEQGRINVEQGRINGLIADFQYQQGKINDLTTERDTLQEQALLALETAQKAMLQTISRGMYLPQNQPVNDDYIEATPLANGRWRIKAKGSWVGMYIFQSSYFPTGGDTAPVLDGQNVDATHPTRTRDHISFASTNSIVTYWVYPGTQKVYSATIPGTEISRDIWVSLGSRAVTHNGPHACYWRVGWTNANHLDSFGVRMQVVRGSEVFYIGPNGIHVNIGPLFGNGYRTQTIDKQNVELQVGDVVRFQAWAGGSSPVNRLITNAWTRMSWVEPPATSTT